MVLYPLVDVYLHLKCFKRLALIMQSEASKWDASAGALGASVCLVVLALQAQSAGLGR